MNTPSDRERIITLNPGIFCFCHSALEHQSAYIKLSQEKEAVGILEGPKLPRISEKFI